MPSCQWLMLNKGQLTFLRILQAAEVAKRNKPTQIHNSVTGVICQETHYCLLGGNTSPAKPLRVKALRSHPSGGGGLFIKRDYEARIAQGWRDIRRKSASCLEGNKNLRRMTPWSQLWWHRRGVLFLQHSADKASSSAYGCPEPAKISAKTPIDWGRL